MNIIVNELGCRKLTAECEKSIAANVICAGVGYVDDKERALIETNLNDVCEEFEGGEDFVSHSWRVGNLHMVTIEIGVKQ